MSQPLISSRQFSEPLMDVHSKISKKLTSNLDLQDSSNTVCYKAHEPDQTITPNPLCSHIHARESDIHSSPKAQQGIHAYHLKNRNLKHSTTSITRRGWMSCSTFVSLLRCDRSPVLFFHRSLDHNFSIDLELRLISEDFSSCGLTSNQIITN